MMTVNTIKECLLLIRKDAFRYTGSNFFSSRIKLYLTTLEFRYVFWMRLCCYLSSSYLFPLYFLARLRLSHISHNSGIQIPDKTEIGAGFYIGHFGTIVINGASVIGCNVNISPGVNIGQANRGANKGVPVIGNNVYIGPGAKIIGAVKIGNNVAIGANAVVTHDVPDNACVAGVPAKVISMDGAEGYVNYTV